MSDTEETRRGAEVKVSAEDLKILEAFHALKMETPKIEKPEDLMSFMKHIGSEYMKDTSIASGETKPGATDLGARPKTTSHHYPKLSTFYGEDNKGEVNWQTFKFELESLLEEKIFSQEQILVGLRRAIKGDASDIVRRLGTGVDIKQVMRKLEGTYGNVETQESILEKFYSSHQKMNETVTNYASRLEEMFTQAVTLGGMNKTDESKLKSVLFRGLRPELKQQAGYKFDTIADYDRFKIELRKIEANMKTEQSESKKCHAAVNVEKNTNEDLMKKLNKTEELLLKLNSRIDKLEKEKSEKPDNQFQQPYSYRGYRGPPRGYYRGRGNFSGRNEGRGRGDYKPQRPIGTGTFQPTCFHCNEKGHIARNCPKV